MNEGLSTAFTRRRRRTHVAAILSLILLIVFVDNFGSPPPPHTSSSSFPSSLGEYVSTLQRSNIDNRAYISELKPENEALSSLLSLAATQEQASSTLSLPFIKQASKAKTFDIPAPPKEEHPSLPPGNYEILSKYNFGQPLAINPDTKFLSAQELVPLEDRTFEISRLSDGRSVSIKHVASGMYLQMRGRGDYESWTVQAECTSPESTRSCRWEIHDSTYVYNSNSDAYMNVIKRIHIRGHDERGDGYGGAKKSPTSEFHFRPQGEAGYGIDSSKHTAVLRYMDSEVEREYIEMINGLPKSNEKRVISFGLYGDDPRYTKGAIRNAELRDTYFPGWTLRFYVDGTVPSDVINELEGLGSEIVKDNGLKAGVGGMFWRFLVADDEGVDRWIIRDADSRLNARDRLAVEEWIESGVCVHSVRDHPNHKRALNGGMWGGKKGCVAGGMKGMIFKADRENYNADQKFLNQVLWPLIDKGDQISHDSYHCSEFKNSRPFPTRRGENLQHVGQVFMADDSPRVGDLEYYVKNNPPGCRPKEHQDWTYG